MRRYLIFICAEVWEKKSQKFCTKEEKLWEAMDTETEFDRILLFEQIRQDAENTYKSNPLDADVSFLFISWFQIQFDLISALWFDGRKKKTNLFDFLFLLLQNLTRWGGVLLELSQFHSISDAKQMIQGSLKLYSVLIWLNLV